MPKQPPKPPTNTGPVSAPRVKPAKGPRRYGSKPGQADEAREPGDRVQGSDGKPVTGQT